MLLEYGPVHAEWTCVHAALVCLLLSSCLLLPYFCCHTSRALLLSYSFFLAGHCSLWSTTCTCIGARALATNRQVAAMAHTTITADFDQPFDVHVHFAAQISLDLVFTVNHLA